MELIMELYNIDVEIKEKDNNIILNGKHNLEIYDFCVLVEIDYKTYQKLAELDYRVRTSTGMEINDEIAVSSKYYLDLYVPNLSDDSRRDTYKFFYGYSNIDEDCYIIHRNNQDSLVNNLRFKIDNVKYVKIVDYIMSIEKMNLRKGKISSVIKSN
jgi:hypothetical protein